MKIVKIKLLTNSVILYLVGRKLCRCKCALDSSQDIVPLTDAHLIKLSNNYQKLLKKWVTIEKKILILRAFILMKNNHNF